MEQTGVKGNLLVLGVEADQPRQRLRRERDAVVEGRLGLGRVLALDQFAQALLRAAEVAPQFLEPQQRAHAHLEITHRDRLHDQVIAACFHHLRALRSRIEADRKSTRLNSSHGYISYAVFCLKKKKEQIPARLTQAFTRLTPSR